MRRTNTIAYGTPVRTETGARGPVRGAGDDHPGARTSLPSMAPPTRPARAIDPRAVVRGSRAIAPAARAASPGVAALGSRGIPGVAAGITAPAPRSFAPADLEGADSEEAAWFTDTGTSAPRYPVGGDLDRRGFTPPNTSRSIVFGAIAAGLVGIAAAGTFFFLSPDGHESKKAAVSTTSLTSADVPTASGTGESISTEPATTGTTVLTVPAGTAIPVGPTGTARPVSPNDLPAAPVAESKAPATPGPGAARATTSPLSTPRARTAAPAGPSRSQAAAPVRAGRESSLPDLDRAATAAGLSAPADDAFASPGSTSGGDANDPRSPAAPLDTAPSTAPPPSAPVTPAAPTPAAPTPPSEAPPADLEIKR